MAAIDTSLAGPQTLNLLAKRNWASQEAGVIVVFCIVFIGETGPQAPRCLGETRR